MIEQFYKDLGLAFAEQYGTTMSQMFGKPCLKTGKKAFAAFFNDEMVFKLGREEVNLLKEKYPHSQNWDPSGKNRPMKDWLQIPNDYKEDWADLAKQALDFVDAHS